MYDNILPQEKKCVICGKKFIARSEYVFKRPDKNKTNFMCSWSCLKKYDEIHDRRRGRKPNEDLINNIRRMIREGKTSKEISVELGISERYARYQMEYYRYAEPNMALDAV